MRRLRRGTLELTVGLGLLLGPMIYALTLEPEQAGECVGVNEEPAATMLPDEQPPQATVVEVELVPVEVEAAPEPVPHHRAPFLFVTDAGVVLSNEAEHAWGKGRLFEPKGEVMHRAAKLANPDTIPAELWSMRGRTFDLYGADGRVCTARLGELRVVAQYGWGLGGVLGEEWIEADPERAPKREILEGLWRRDDLWLVAEIESPDRCKGALWARDAELPPPVILRGSSVPNRASETRLAAFAKSEVLAETERNYRAEYAKLDEEAREYIPSWETVVAEHGARVWSWLDASGHPQLIRLDFGLEPGGCGDPFVSSITALEHVRGQDFIEIPYGGSPNAVFDADFDGQFELLYSSAPGYAFLSSATLHTGLSIEEDFYCPC